MAPKRLKDCTIVLAVGSLKMGGAERQVLLLANYLQQHCGCRVVVAGLGEPGELSDLCIDRKIRCIQLPLPLDKSAGLAANARNLLRFRNCLAGLMPDILLSYTALVNVGCSLVWRLCGAKACIWNQRDAGLGFHRIKWKPLFRLSSQYVSNSAHAGQMLERCSVPSARITVIRNGVDIPEPLNRKDAIRAEMNLRDSKVVCMIGNIHPLKDHMTLAKAWKIVVRECAMCRPILLLAGREDDSGTLRPYLAEHGLNQSVRILGHVNDIAGLLEAVDVGCFSSHTEGLPNGVLELMAMGLPVAATDLPGTREILGADPLQLAPAGDHEDLAAKIIRLIKDEDLCRQIGHKNLLKVRECFSVKTMCRKYVDLIAGVCEK